MQLSTFSFALLFALFAVACSRLDRGVGLRRGRASCDEVSCSGNTQCVEIKVGFGRKARVRAKCVRQRVVPDPSCDDLDCGNGTCVLRKRGRALRAVCVAPATTSCDDLDCGNGTCVVRKRGRSLEAVCVEPVITSCDELECGNDVCIVRNKGRKSRAVCVSGEVNVVATRVQTIRF